MTKFSSEKIFMKKKVKKRLHFGGAKYSKNFACGGQNAWRAVRGGGGNPFPSPPLKNNASMRVHEEKWHKKILNIFTNFTILSCD